MKDPDMFARKASALAALALITIAASAGSAAAAQEREDQSVVVRFGDLDLARPSGLARLDTRLRYAATAVCNSRSRDLNALREDSECRARALAGARTEVAAITSKGGARTEVAMRR
jgi:UrcA family protein